MRLLPTFTWIFVSEINEIIKCERWKASKRATFYIVNLFSLCVIRMIEKL